MPMMLSLFLPTYSMLRIFLNSAHKRAQYAKWNNVSHVWKDDFPLYLDFLFQSVSSWCLLCFSFVVLSCFQLCCIPLSELMKSHYPLKKKKKNIFEFYNLKFFNSMYKGNRIKGFKIQKLINFTHFN